MRSIETIALFLRSTHDQIRAGRENSNIRSNIKFSSTFPYLRMDPSVQRCRWISIRRKQTTNKKQKSSRSIVCEFHRFCSLWEFIGDTFLHTFAFTFQKKPFSLSKILQNEWQRCIDKANRQSTLTTHKTLHSDLFDLYVGKCASPAGAGTRYQCHPWRTQCSLFQSDHRWAHGGRIRPIRCEHWQFLSF